MRDRIIKLSPIHASVIYEIRWIAMLSYMVTRLENTRFHYPMWKMTALRLIDEKDLVSVLKKCNTPQEKNNSMFYCRKKLRRRVLYVCTCRHSKKILNFLEHMFTTSRYHKSMLWYCVNFHWYLRRKQKN